MRTLEVKQRPATELCRRETVWPKFAVKQMEKQIDGRVYSTQDQLCKFAEKKFTLMASAVSQLS